jgi:hypothetical protein
MTQNRSKWMLACAAAMVAAMTSRAAAQQPNEVRIRELIRQAAERVASGQTGAPPPAQTPGTQSDTRPVVRLALDDAVKDALDHNLDIAVQRLKPEISDISYASIRSVYNPAITSLFATQSQLNPATTTIAGGTLGAPIDTGLTTKRRSRPEHSVGRRQLQRRAEQQQSDDDQPERAVQPDVQHELVGTVYAAALEGIQDRLDAATARGHENQSRHLGRAAARDHHQYALQRAQRLLGLRVRETVG